MEHLLLVACGMDSAQAGEQEIYVQLRAAWQAAREAQVSGPLLDRIFSEAMNMARMAHRIATHDAPSLADLAVGARAAASRRPRSTGRHGGPGGRLADDAPLRAAAARARGGRDGHQPLARYGPGTGHGTGRDGSVAGRHFAHDPASHGCAALVCASGATEPVIDRDVLVKLATRGRC